MSAIPPDELERRLRDLGHDEFVAFVASVWEKSGWETDIDGPVVVAENGKRTRRLYVLPPGRFRRFRSRGFPSLSSADGSVDSVVTARFDDSLSPPENLSDVEVIDAGDIRHRLLYGMDNNVAEELWQEYTGTSLRGEQWDEEPREIPVRAAVIAVFALVLVGGAVAILVGGLPFVEDESTLEVVNETSLEGGLDRELPATTADVTLDSSANVASGTTAYFGTDNGTVHAIDGETGSPRWERSLSGPAGIPIVVDGTVYVRSFGSVYALDGLTGEREWVNTDTIGSSTDRPTVVDNTVYVGDAAGVYAINASTGRLVWETRTPGASVAGSPAVANGTVYIGSQSGTVFAFDSETGEQTWARTDLGSTYYPTPVALSNPSRDLNHNGTQGKYTLLIRSLDAIHVLDAESGELLWEHDGLSISSAPAVYQSSEEDLTGNDTASDGDGNATIYLPTTDGRIHEIDGEAGAFGWTYSDRESNLWRPTVDALSERNRTVYVTGTADDEWSIRALDARTGNGTWRFTAEGSSVEILQTSRQAMPTVADGTVYVSAGHGVVYALDAASGTETFRQDVSDDDRVLGPTVVRNPARGDSVDSRVLLGTEGHHQWSYRHGQSDTRDPLDETDDQDRQLRIFETTVPATIGAGERGEIGITIVNTGSETRIETVTLDTGWELTDDQAPAADVELDPGEAVAVRFSFVAPHDVGEYEYGVRTGAEDVHGSVSVVEPPVLEIVELDDPSEAVRGGQIEVIATIKNSGDVAVTTPLALEFNGEIVERTERTIEANDTVAVTFAFDIDGRIPAGEYSYAVATADGVQTETFEVIAVDDRSDVMPILVTVTGLTLLVLGMALVWWLYTSVVGERDRTRYERWIPQRWR